MTWPTLAQSNGGKQTTAKQAAARRKNGCMPCAEGKKRGWKKGVPRKKPEVKPPTEQ